MSATEIGALRVSPVARLVLGLLSDTPLLVTAGAERHVSTGVVHVVALDALVHGANAAADYVLAAARQVIGETDARAERCPVVGHHAVRVAVHAGDANAIQIELEGAQCRRSGWCPDRGCSD